MADGIRPARSGLWSCGEDLARPFEVIAGVKKIGDVQAVLDPTLDLVEVSPIGLVGIVGLAR